jgi:hypothetical protein
MDEIAVSNYQLEITAPLSLAGVSQADLIDSNSIAFRFLCGEDNFLCPSARVCISISTVPESACSRSAVELQILALQLRKISTKERSEDDLLRGDRCSAVPRRTGVQDFHVRDLRPQRVKIRQGCENFILYQTMYWHSNTDIIATFARLSLRIRGSKVSSFEDRKAIQDDISNWLEGCAILLTELHSRL